MPLILHQQLKPQGEFGIWKLTELESYFLANIDFEIGEKAEYERMQKGRRLEWLGVRWLLHQLSGRAVRGTVRKDEFGKPYLVDSAYEISLSHSHQMAAVIAAPKCVGIDIQQIVPKIVPLAPKFMRTEEMESLESSTELEHLHVYWGAKEALYKAYGRRQLDFRKHIFVQPFSYDVSNGQCVGSIKRDDVELHFSIFYQKIENYILVYAIQDGKENGKAF